MEVSGRDSRVYDREYKRDAYLAAGVHEVWLIDLASRTVETSRPDARDAIAADGTLVWTSPAGAEIRIAVADLFGQVPWRDPPQ